MGGSMGNTVEGSDTCDSHVPSLHYLHFRFFGKLGFFDVVASFDYHIQLPHGFFMLESIISMRVSIGNFFFMDRFQILYSGKVMALK